jgi:hypothetical protein
MANFIGLVYATLKQEGIDTSGMSSEEAVAKYNELQKQGGGKAGENEGTPAEQQKLRENDINNAKKAIASGNSDKAHNAIKELGFTDIGARAVLRDQRAYGDDLEQALDNASTKEIYINDNVDKEVVKAELDKTNKEITKLRESVDEAEDLDKLEGEIMALRDYAEDLQLYLK